MELYDEFKSSNETRFLSQELEKLDAGSNVLPFCVYHWFDESQRVYRGFLAGPKLTRENGKISYKCGNPPLINYNNSLNRRGHGWKLAFTFYAINPRFRPIPYGMGLFCAKRRLVYPFDTTQVTFTYDPYDVSNNCVYFITYTKPVPFTDPIYVHITGNNYFSPSKTNKAFPSLNSNPPERNNNFSREKWGRSDIFPFYIMSPKTFGPNPESIKFVCYNTVCLPYLPNNYLSNNAVNITHRGKVIPRQLKDCVTHCNLQVHSAIKKWPTSTNHPFNLIEIINAKLNSIKKVRSTFSGRIADTPHILSPILIFALIIGMGILLYVVLSHIY